MVVVEYMLCWIQSLCAHIFSFVKISQALGIGSWAGGLVNSFLGPGRLTPTVGLQRRQIKTFLIQNKTQILEEILS
jgi:hypothetical protein